MLDIMNMVINTCSLLYFRKLKHKIMHNIWCRISSFNTCSSFFSKDLTLIISTELSEAEVELEEDLEEMSSVQIDSFAKEQEWTLHECVSFTPKVTTKAYTNPKFKNPTVVAGCFAGRRAGFFIWNVMLIMVIFMYIYMKCCKINIVQILFKYHKPTSINPIYKII